MRVRLVGVTGDQEDFADLIGTEGKLELAIDKAVYMPDNRGDWLTMKRRRVLHAGGMVTVATKLRNTFTFKKLDG